MPTKRTGRGQKVRRMDPLHAIATIGRSMDRLSGCGVGTRSVFSKKNRVKSVACSSALQGPQSEPISSTFRVLPPQVGVNTRAKDYGPQTGVLCDGGQGGESSFPLEMPPVCTPILSFIQFLRKKLIGKHVHAHVDFVRPREGDYEERECATVRYGNSHS